MALVYDHNYTTREDGRGRHTWSVKGEAGGIHIWASERTGATFNPDERFYGGVEVHSRCPIYDDQTVSHDECWLIGGPCYHDGTSLYFTENIEPLLHSISGDAVPDGLTEYLNAELLDWYRSKLDQEAQ